MPGTPSDRVVYGINVQATLSTSHRSPMNAQESPEGNIAHGCPYNIAGRASWSAMTSLSVVVQAALRVAPRCMVPGTGPLDTRCPARGLVAR